MMHHEQDYEVHWISPFLLKKSLSFEGALEI